MWHGVDACRMLMLGTVERDPVLFVIHLAVLVAITLIGAALAARTIEARLVKG